MSTPSSVAGTQSEGGGPTRVLTLSLVLSILLIIAGVVALMLAAETSIAVIIIVAWVLMVGGLVQAIDAFRSKGVGLTIWKLVVALAYFITGLVLVLHLGLGLAALTLALVLFFAAEGVMSIIAYFRTRNQGASGWLLLDGIITLMLGFLIWIHWPTSATWILGVFVGVNMILNGATRLMLTLAARRILKGI